MVRTYFFQVPHHRPSTKSVQQGVPAPPQHDACARVTHPLTNCTEDFLHTPYPLSEQLKLLIYLFVGDAQMVTFLGQSFSLDFLRSFGKTFSGTEEHRLKMRRVRVTTER